ncbi:MAG: NRDE family protein [Polyangiaceae bacterium]
MCLVLLALEVHPEYPLVVAANRDEFHARPTAKAEFWADAPSLFAGRDLSAGGTWLGVTRSGRFAAVTNVRAPGARTGTRSRGDLTRSYLVGDRDARDAALEVIAAGRAATSAVPPRTMEKSAPDALDSGAVPPRTMEKSAPEALDSGAVPPRTLEKSAPEALDSGAVPPRTFNLVVGSVGALFVTDGVALTELARGVRGVSNAAESSLGGSRAWPKVERGEARLAEVLAAPGPIDTAALFEMLADRSRAPDELLPDTGVGLEAERFLSSAFLVSPLYGTRSSTVLTVDRRGRVTFEERSFGPDGGGIGVVRETFTVQS